MALRTLWAKLLGLLQIGRQEGTGPLGERLASEYLQRQGYSIEARNFRAKGGEADIIASRGGLLVVVEVKTRKVGKFGSPAEAVTSKKARRVVRAGRSYCRSKGISLAKLRCDVVAVELSMEGSEPSIRHYPAAIAL